MQHFVLARDSWVYQSHPTAWNHIPDVIRLTLAENSLRMQPEQKRNENLDFGLERFSGKHAAR